jgi:hypothetical protein
MIARLPWGGNQEKPVLIKYVDFVRISEVSFLSIPEPL